MSRGARGSAKLIHAAGPLRQRPVRIACIKRTKAALGGSLATLTKALQKCYDEHFLPVWGYPVKLYNTQNPKPTDWRMVYVGNAADASNLGYHDLTFKGQPISYVLRQKKPGRW